MTTTHTRTKSLTAAVGAVIAGAAAPALLFLGAGTAHAIQDISERGGIAIIADLPTPRACPGCGGINPQPDPPGFPDPGSRVGISDSEDSETGAIQDSEKKPDITIGGFNPQPDPPGVIDPGSAVGIGDEENMGP